MGTGDSELFRSFWMGGFECSCHINHLGHRLDMTAGVQHDQRAESDYALLRTQEMRTARDGVRWHLVDRGNGTYDFSSFVPMLTAALRQNVQVIWDLCHYGWPDGLDVFSPAFVERFARFSAAVARVVREHTDEVPFYSPVNEISFFSWGASRGLMYPYAEGRDHELKRQLVRAAIAAIEGVRGVETRARFTFPEPVIHVVPDPACPEQQPAARQYTESQFEAWDMVAGFAQPELGGRPDYLDIVGCNFYATSEWQVFDGRRIQWDDIPRDPRWRPLSQLVQAVWERYGRPLYVAETSHIGVGRGEWILEIAEEVRMARGHGVPVEGICLYPILDRYDWGDFHHWHNSGLWDLRLKEDAGFERVLDARYAEGLRLARAAVGQAYNQPGLPNRPRYPSESA